MANPVFYRVVMSTPLPKKKKAPPEPKSKARKLRPGFSADKIDLFKTFLEADVGKDPESQHSGFFDIHLKRLSKKELSRLLKKIERLRADCLEGSDEHEVVDSLFRKTDGAISERMRISGAMMDELKSKIEEKLRIFLPLNAKKLRNQIFISRPQRCLRFGTFVNTHFSEYADEFNSLVEKGVIIPNSRTERGVDFVKRTLLPFLQFPLV